MSEEEAKVFRVKQLEVLREEVLSIVQTIDKLSTVATFNKPSNNSMPPLNFQFIPCNCDNSAPSKNDVTISPFKYPKRSSLDILTNLIGQYAAFANPKSKPLIKIGILGGDTTLHNILCSYICLKTTAPKSFDGLDLQFFVLPADPSDFCKFLSRYDGWYFRHVYCMQKCLLRVLPSSSTLPLLSTANPPNVTLERSQTKLAPVEQKSKSWSNGQMDKSIEEINKMSLASRSVTSMPRQRSLRFPTNSTNEETSGTLFQGLAELYGSDETPPTPSTILRNEMQNYFREALWRLEINTYRCECWDADGNYFTIPFCQRAEISVRSFTRAQKKESSKNTLTNFKFAPPVVGIKFTQMNVVGQSKQGIPIEPRPYNSIVIANIPTQGDRGVVPNPTKLWLEMTLMEAESAKKRKAKSTDKDLDSATISGYHVSVVDLEVDDKKKGIIYLLLDDVLYGPFYRARVGAGLNGEDVFTMPFMTFFPLDLPS